MLIIPEDPTPNLVQVKNIAKETQEKTIKDFFLFCGKIEACELVPDEDGKHQKAHILFERPSAAKTAVLLSNALVNGSNIVVQPFFEDGSHETNAATANTQSDPQDTKLVSPVMTELLAAGYTLTDPVLQKGIEFDTKYGVTALAHAYFTRIQQNLQELDQRFGVTDKAMDVDHRLGIQEKAKHAADAVLQSGTGQKVQGLASKLLAMHEEARRIAALRKSSDPEGKDNLD